MSKQRKKITTTMVKLADLKFDGDNSRTHDEKNLNAIRASINRFDQVEPLVVQKSTMIVIGGNGRMTVMRELGWEECECKVLDISDDDARALGIALNRTGELAGWDDKQLAKSLNKLREKNPLAALAAGFTEREMDKIGMKLNKVVREPKADASAASDFGGNTAMTRKSVPMATWTKAGYFKGKKKKLVLDFGSGLDPHDFMRYDPFHAPDPEPLLYKFDVITCNYVLNVQPADHLITQIAALVSKLLRPEGVALFAIRNDMEVGIHKSDRGVQNIKTADEWMSLIGCFFANKHLKKIKKFIAIECRPLS